MAKIMAWQAANERNISENVAAGVAGISSIAIGVAAGVISGNNENNANIWRGGWRKWLAIINNMKALENMS